MHPPVDDADSAEVLRRAVEFLRGAKQVAVLTGAGVSAESGLATFRGSGGLWEGHRVEDVGTPMAFKRDPALVWRFYNARRANLRTAAPNPGHHALAALEKRYPAGDFTLITQNVDGLHQAAGSRQVLELHGSLARVRCTGCGQTAEPGLEPLADLPRCATCQALLRPAIVWFHETLPEETWRQAEEAVGRCQCLLVVGTSAIVYPAAGLIDEARLGGARVVEINMEATAVSVRADVGLYGASGQILPRLVQQLC
jgi:NAD-dependent deacetylase